MNETLYQDLTKLEQRFILIKSKLSYEEIQIIEQELAELKKEMIYFDNGNLSKKRQVVKKMVELEIKYLNETKAKEIIRQNTLDSINNQLDTVESLIEKEREKVEEFLVTLEETWNGVKDTYNELQREEINKKILNISIKCALQKLKTTGKIDKNVINRYYNNDAYNILLQMLMKKSETLNGIQKVTVITWINKVIDINTGLINQEEMKNLVTNKEFWEILSGKQVKVEEKRQVVAKNKEGKRQIVAKSKEEKEQQIGSSRYDKIKEMSKRYGVRIGKLATDEIIIIVRNRVTPDDISIRGKIEYKYTAVRMNFDEFCHKSSFSDGNRFVAAILGDGITEIPARLFSRTFLSEIILPESLEIICEEAFYGTRLREVEIPKRVELIGHAAFSHCDLLKSVKLPENLKIISCEAFAESGLTNIELPKRLDSLGIRAFESCEDLETVIIPGTIRIIQSEVFCGCSNLVKVTIKDGVRYIFSKAFAYTALKEIDIPSTVININSNAFNNCRFLDKVNCTNDKVMINSTAFNDTPVKKALQSQLCNELNQVMLLKQGIKPIEMQTNAEELNDYTKRMHRTRGMDR